MTSWTIYERALQALILCAAVLVSGCGGGSGDDPIDESELVDEPLSGSVQGAPFEIVGAGTVTQIGGSTVISLRNYPWQCSGNVDRPPDSALLINFGVLSKQIGLDAVEFGSPHAATLQKGIGSDSSAADTAPVRKGLIRLDTFSEEEGAQVTGALLFRTADDEINGAFSATVCP